MNTSQPMKRLKFPGSIAAAAVFALAAYSGLAFSDDNLKITLAGTQEVPPVMTAATGMGTVTVKDDKTVTGSVATKGLNGTMAHIHQGALGVNGPVLITLTKSGDGMWKVPDGTKLTDDQYKAYKAGELYINVHTAEHKGGELRGQLKQP